MLRRWGKRVLLATGIVLFLVFPIGGGIFLVEVQVHAPRRPVPGAPAFLQETSIRTSDGLTLRAWFAQPAHPNGDAVILLHGIADNRAGVAGHGQLLLNHGYAVLLPDSRTHGTSDGIASFGLKETDDVHRWADWLYEKVNPHCLFGLGESMGAGILLQSIAVERRFCAVIAESPFADARAAIYDRASGHFGAGPWLGKTLLRPAIEFGWLYARWKYGMRFDDVSPRRAVAASRTPVLLINDLADTNLLPHNSREIFAARQNGAPIELWEVPGASHCGARSRAPEEFDRRVLTWLAAHGSIPTSQPPAGRDPSPLPSTR
jgi:dipeptidyl aminopeptidase/acylaminoacyl peptidase